MFGRKLRYRNAISIENAAQAVLVCGMEGADFLDRNRMEEAFSSNRAIKTVLAKPRRYWEAVMISLRYSKLGIFNCIICVNDNPTDNFKD